MDKNEREMAEFVAQARGEELAQFHAGLKQGRKEGEKIGEDKVMRKFVKNMIKNNLDLSLMTKLSGLSEDQIQAYSMQ